MQIYYTYLCVQTENACGSQWCNCSGRGIALLKYFVESKGSFPDKLTAQIFESF